MKKKNIASDKW